MTKKGIKEKKKKPNSKTKHYKTKNIKGRIHTDPAKLPISAKIVLSILLVILLILCFINMGFLFTVFVAIMILIIIGIAKLLDSAKKNSKKRKVINIILILCLIMGILALSLFAAFLVYVTVNAPKFDTSQLDTKESTIIYDKDGKEIIKLGTEMRDKVEFNELPQVLVDAIIATEDSRFYQHNGLDVPRFLKASMGQVFGKSSAGGASTLSMQVIKNSFTSTEASGIKGIIRKFTDIYLAVFKLEKNYSKEEIIEFYVNNHFLGGNVYGVQEASRAYFGKDVSDLNLSEASILAGMFKSPNLYRPNVNPKNATRRRDTVLYLMKHHGYITEEEYNLAKSIPVESLTSGQTNTATSKYQGYIDTVVEEIDDKYNINAYTTPLLIYTNMDRGKQDGVNDVLDGVTYSWIDDKVQTGVSVLDSQTGKVLAVGNGRNRSGDGVNSFNYTTQIKRQPGSSAKPLFDYGPGIEYNNWSTYTLFDDAPYSYSNGRSIKNWDNGYFGTITMRRALSTSRNIPALKAFQQVDNKKIIEFVTNLGIEPEISNGQIHEAHSIGAFTGVSPLTMSAAYAAFSNGGYYNEPYTVSKIVFRDTNKTEEHKVKPKQVMSDATAFMISSMLQDVALTGGTPKNVAAKTGTTNFDDVTMEKYGLPGDAIRDSWVVGYTTKTVIGMWYGYDKISKEYCLRNLPATIQKDKLFQALAKAAFESNREEFKMPDSVVKLGIIAGSNPPQVAKNGEGNVVYEYFKKGHEPEEGAQQLSNKLETPGNLKVNYNGNKVTISWDGVSRLEGDENYGTLGYNVYQGNTLLKFVEGTSYTFETTNPYATYRVVATYKSYSGAQSEAASYQLTEDIKKSDFTCDCGGESETVDVGSALPTGNICTFKYKGSALSKSEYPITVDTSDCSENGVFKSTASTCKITFFIKYKSTTVSCQKNYKIEEVPTTPPTPPTPPTTTPDPDPTS